MIKAFEMRTGATVNRSTLSWNDFAGPKMRTNMQNGIIPTMFNSSDRWTGQFRALGFLRPLDDFINDRLDASLRESIEWLFPIIAEQNRGFEDPETIYDFPHCLQAQSPLLVRVDHVAEIGIDVDKDFPLRDSDHFLEVCLELKKAGRQYPTEIYGSRGDMFDTHQPGLIRFLDLESSHFIDPTWSRSMARSDAWLQTFEFYADIYRKHELSSPNTLKSGDEYCLEHLILGRRSIANIDFSNRGTLVEKGQDLIDEGKVRYFPNFHMAGGTTGCSTFLINYQVNICNQTGPDAAIKEEAAFELIKEFMLPENQATTGKLLAFPSRKDVWDSLRGTPDRFADVSIEMFGQPGLAGWYNHPKSIDYQYFLPHPRGQKFLQGASVKEELSAYADEVDAALKA